MSRSAAASALLSIAILLTGASLAAPSGDDPGRLPWNEPVQVTAEADSVEGAAATPDGRILVYVSGRGRFRDLWLRSADPHRFDLPRQLTFDPADETEPALSRNGRFLAYVGTGYDVKGDIYLLDLEEKGAKPRRLTGRETEDRAPAFSPDGGRLYFQRSSGREAPSLAVIDLSPAAAPLFEALPLETGGDARSPAPSPDGRFIVFLSFRDDPGGDLYLFEPSAGTVSSLTDGVALDRDPAWAADGVQVLFSRRELDTDGDGRVTERDRASLQAVDAAGESPRPFPLTSLSRTATEPAAAGGRVLFLGDRGGVHNVWSLPLEGEVPLQTDAAAQLRLAEGVAERVPHHPFGAVLAFARVEQAFPDDAAAATAAFRAGEILFSQGYSTAAARSWNAAARSSAAGASPVAALARIALAAGDTRRAWEEALGQEAKDRILAEGEKGLADIAAGTDIKEVAAQAELERARLHLDLGRGAAALGKAVKMLELVEERRADLRTTAAAARLLRANAVARLGNDGETDRAYLSVVERYGSVPPVSGRAVRRLLDLRLTPEMGLDEQVRGLRDLADRNRSALPPLSAGALLRIGDLWFEADEWDRAKSAYRQVLEEFPALSSPRASARLALAEILYREERFRRALDLYEHEIGERPPEDRVYRLARRGYIRKTVEAGDFLIGTGEIASARALYRDLIRYDDSVVEAHRGYIGAAAALGDLSPVLGDYRRLLELRPDDPLLLYAVGLCLTYRDRAEDLREARGLISQAIARQGQVEYYHQTLGYVLETLETVHGEAGSLELAAESYRRALFLNDEHENPSNRAHLLLNVGNAHYLLGQPGLAYRYYEERLRRNLAFPSPETEIIFYRRFGEAAFQVRDEDGTVAAFEKALELLRSRADTKKASDEFDRVRRTIVDHLLAPWLRDGNPMEAAAELAEEQSDLRARIFTATADEIPAVPSPEWSAYRQTLEDLRDEQERIVGRVLFFLAGAGAAPDEVEKGEATLRLQIRRIGKALAAPVRFADLETELMDRLALGYQEAGRWGEAAETFDRVRERNRRAGRLDNLARGRRAAAYARYRLAGEVTGEERERLLGEAEVGFREAVDLVLAHGVPARESEERRGLIRLSSEQALDAAGATEAARGFTAEQEMRLAAAFLARIAVERGNLPAARKALELQLQSYPDAAGVAEGDRYGVSLLHHRAGLLAHAAGDREEAARRFADSAALALAQGNGASAAISVANLAESVLSWAREGEPERVAEFLPRLENLDRSVTEELRKGSPSAVGTALSYHGTVGLVWLQLAADTGPVAVGTPRKMRRLEKAVRSFSRGISTAGEEVPAGRDRIAALARLHLGLAAAAAALGDGPGIVAEPGGEALRLARHGLLPDLEWRALATTGRLVQALEVLRGTPIVRAHASPGEITEVFSPLVEDLLKRDAGEALALMEELSELERVHRLAPEFLGGISAANRLLLRNVYPRLLRTEALRRKMAAAEGEEYTWLEERLLREEALLDERLGAEREKLAGLPLFSGPGEVRDATAALLGLAYHAEELAAAAVRGDDSPFLREEREGLVRRFSEELKKARERFPEEGPLLVLGPDPADAAEVMDAFAEGEGLVRVLRDGERRSWRALVLTAGDFAAVEAGDADSLVAEAENALAELGGDRYALAWERPSRFASATGPASLALSATHWLRSYRARKPFRRTLRIAGEGGQEEPFTWAAAAEVHTLFLGGRVARRGVVPTREGERGRRVITLDLPGGPTMPLAGALGRLPRASLVALRGWEPTLIFETGHLFSLAGSPTTALPRPGAGGARPESIAAYAGGGEPAAVAAEWTLLGYRLPNGEEARALATERFADYVRLAREDFEQGRPKAALGSVEDALLVAEELEPFARHRAELLRFAREAAFAAGEVERSARYAAALVEDLARTSPDTDAHADALLRLGLVLARLQRYDEALPVLEEAAEMLANLDRMEGAVQAVASMGVVLENATRYDSALESFEKAADLSSDLELTALLAVQEANLGRLYDLRLSRYAQARQFYERALGHYNETGDLPGVIRSLVDIGRCERLLGNFPSADERYTQALELLEEEPDPILRAKTRIEQANNAWFQGRYQEAFEVQREVLALARSEGWDQGRVMAYNTSGLTWWTLGDNDRALRDLERALDLARTLEGREDEVATTLNNIGLVHREAGRYDAALETLERALAIDRRLRSLWAVAYDLRNLGLTHLRRGGRAAAMPLLREAVEKAETIGDGVNRAKGLLALGEALWEGGDVEAEILFSEALEAARSMALREVEWRALFGIARIGIAGGDLAGAAETLREAVQVVEGMRAEIRLEQLRDGFLSSKMDVYETLVEVLVELEEDEEAFETAERSRSRSFIDLLGTQRLSLKGAVDRELYERHQVLQARLGEQETLAAQAGEGERSVYDDAAAGLKDEIADLLLEMQRRDPQLAALVSVEPVGTREIRELLDPATALLSYYVLPRQVLCWILRRDDLELVRIPRDRSELGEAIFAYRRLVQNLEPVEKASVELHRTLLEPVLGRLGDAETVGVIPHGPLHYLSFATLFDGERYLVDRFPLFYLPSASVLRYTLQRRQSDPNRRVLAIGNPDLGVAALALPFAEEEVGTIRWNFPDVTLLTGKRATESWVVRNLKDFGIIHLAAHGEFDPVNPLFSALKLARGPEGDGDLRTAEVFALEISADLVVLSACQTGLGRVTRGDDVIGLNRAFFYAGTHAVVSSLWRVSDISTALLMKQFYRRYAELDKAGSLRAAMLHVKTLYPHPGYWGAFTLSGDSR